MPLIDTPIPKRKTAIVTGGAQGIGKCICKMFLADGMNVVAADIDAESGNECSREFKTDRFKFLKYDVRNEKAVRICVEKTVEFFGGIDVLVNNVGIFSGGKVQALSLEDWNRVIETNLTAVFLFAKFAIPHLEAEKGSIVNISSTRALQSEKDTEAYSASKGGLLALTHALAVSLAGTVRVNCISPGWIDVSMWKKKSSRKKAVLSALDHSQHPVGRVGIPEDIAEMALFLVSEKAGFITGQNFVVDGGMTRKMIYVE